MPMIETEPKFFEAETQRPTVESPKLGQACPKMAEISVDRVAIQTGQVTDFSGFHIQKKQEQQEPIFLPQNSGTLKL